MTTTPFSFKRMRRHASVARLLLRYGRSDLMKFLDVEEVFRSAGDEGDMGDPDLLACELERLGPTFVKLGQLLSTRPDLLPAKHVEALARLQDDVEPLPFEAIAPVIEEELGVRISKAFESIDREPLASASLGQVHHAVMRGGRHVAVKVQRPGVRQRVLEDLEMLEQMAAFVDGHSGQDRWDLASLVAQLRASLARELDFEQEARNLETLARLVAGLDRIIVPLPVMSYTSARVLTMDFVRGCSIRDVSPLRRSELDGAVLSEQLFRAYLEQILVHGFFHADPHPGNVLLTDDDHLALIDLGMVAHVSPRLRDQLLKLVVAVSNGDGDDAAEIAWQIGTPLDGADRGAVRRDIAALVAWNERLTVKDIQVGRVVLEIMRVSGRGGLRIPPDLALLGKALLNLDKVTRVLDPDFDPNAAVRRHASEIASRRVRAEMRPDGFIASFVDARDLARSMPRQLGRILDAAANNELSFRVDAIDEDRLISGMQKIANRITLGLVLAALIVGAALIMRVETSFMILGYPGLAIILFLAAAAGGGGLAARIVWNDGRNRKRRAR